MSPRSLKIVLPDSNRVKLCRNWAGQNKPSVVVVGNFDGVHLGHMSLLQAMQVVGKQALRKLALTFEPHPLVVLRPARQPKRLLDLRTKVRLLAESGIDQVNVLHFTQQLASMPARIFVQKMLSKLGMQRLVVGSDFRFGKGREGDVILLRNLAKEFGFTLIEQDAHNSRQGVRVSSKLLRNVIAHGEFSKAAELLGRPYSFGGRVVHGEQLGRQLCCPTANLGLRGEPPLHGVYAAWAEVSGNRWPAAVGIGRRVALNGKHLTVEAHLIGYAGDLYGEFLALTPVAKIRDEENFPDLEKLRIAMQDDIGKCLQLLISGKDFSTQSHQGQDSA